ncbi:protein NRT1/ PTR FAMILY 1.1 [Ziziphus jujuba]|uniref:Protein NRT1/ PTR FAMILY 1.1 n=2 Tax=Ziziphus jujuba TaxID=326968 RepID=A0A6P3YWL5_ZIZJJ|nr:protein NRT1/ PTR FAMILY 1.1 [Ziziphus jujuba]KAH7547259.1 hypothetical protein FEM48_Zijuj01G0290900 [Ziziphus jujuba var. spinosa]
MEKMKKMEASPDLMETANEDGVTVLKRSRKGGFKTMPFIIANEAFEKVASYGLTPNMILYLMRDYHLGVTTGSNILFYWSAATNFLPIVGAFLSDFCLGRFLTIALGCIFSLLGMVLLWLTAMIPGARPPSCDQFTESCKSATFGQMAFLISAFMLMSVGAGGVRPCSMAFGADQLINKKEGQNSERLMESFFSWYYAAASVAVVIAFTGIVYIQDHLGWKIGFGIPAILMFISALSFFLASSIYVKEKANRSLFTGIAQAASAAYKNRKLPLPPRNAHVLYHHKDSETVAPTDKLRFLNKGCTIRNPEQDLAPDGSASNPWKLCTAGQVEDLKALIKVIPIWSTGLLMSINISQVSFPLLQANSMNRHVTSGFEIPAGSFGMFTIISLTIWVALYDRVIIPLASKIRGKRVQLNTKQRMGIGIFLSTMAMAVSAIVEGVRRRKAIEQGFMNDAKAVVNMSALWLVPQHCINGLAEAFNAIGQMEFYYSEFPRSMSSIATSLFGLGLAAANLLASAILSSVDKYTSRGGKVSWVSSNINKGHYDYYYWVLAGISFVNFIYFIVCSWAYGPCADDMLKVGHIHHQTDSKKQELPKVGNGDTQNGLKEQELSKLVKGDEYGGSKEPELPKLGNGIKDEKKVLEEGEDELLKTKKA